MGGTLSRRLNRSRKSVKTLEDGVNSAEKVTNETKEDKEVLLDKQYIEDIRKDLDENPEIFVLNNMLMAVMFFENYPRLVY